MDLLGDSPSLTLNDDGFRIFFRSTASAPQYIGDEASVENSVIAEGSEIYGTVRNSIIGSGVFIDREAVVEDSVLMNGTRVGGGANVRYAVLDTGVTVGERATVGAGEASADRITVIGADTVVPDGAELVAGVMVSA